MKKLKIKYVLAIAAALCFAAPGVGNAAIVGTANYDNDSIKAIFGTGNPDGDFVSATFGEVEVALRFKNRFTGDTSNNGAGLWTFATAPDANFEFSLGSGSQPLSAYTFQLRVDTDPTAGVDYTLYTFDPILAYADNSYGNSGTANGAGVEGNFALSNANSLAQNSQRMIWYGAGNGLYDVQLSVFDKATNPNLLARTEVQAQIGVAPVPEPTTALFGAALLGVVGLQRRRRAVVN